MKKIYFLLIVFGVLIWSCSPEEAGVENFDNSAKLFDGGPIGDVDNETDGQDTDDEGGDDATTDYGTIYSGTMTAGQTIPAGTVSVVASEATGTVLIDYTTADDWVVTEYHIYVGAYGDLPRNGAGHPRIGHFPISDEYVDPATGDVIDTGVNYAPGDCNFVAVHVVVVNTVTGQEETAWMFGTTPVDNEGNQSGWAMGSFVPEGCGE